MKKPFRFVIATCLLVTFITLIVVKKMNFNDIYILIIPILYSTIASIIVFGKNKS